MPSKRPALWRKANVQRSCLASAETSLASLSVRAKRWPFSRNSEQEGSGICEANGDTSRSQAIAAERSSSFALLLNLKIKSSKYILMPNKHSTVQDLDNGSNSAKLPVIRSLPKQKLSRKQMKAIREILGYTFEETIRQSPFAWLLDNPPSEWNDSIRYPQETGVWDTAETFARIAEEYIQKLMVDTDGNDV